MRRSIRSVSAAALALPAFLALACGKPADEVLIRRLLEETVARAEKGEVPGLETFFAHDYRDFEGRDTAGTLRLITDHIGRYKNVVIHLLGSRIDVARPAGGLATVECEVSLSHGAAEVLRKLIRYTGEYYRFRLSLREAAPSAWRFTSAEWQPIGLTELFPESLDVLRKLFPGL